MGRYVPGGISGDIVLSQGAVAHERKAVWTEERRKYGTDISTTFDNIADDQTVIYEVYLGAKLHDITDEGKLRHSYAPRLTKIAYTFFFFFFRSLSTRQS